MIRIGLPLSEKDVRALNAGDRVSLSGVIVTARDAAHRLMVEKWPEFIAPLLLGGAIYHCGPVMRKEKDGWKAVAAGPTTSIREEPYEARVIEHYGVRLIIGKGGMGQKTLEALKRCGAAYIHAPGGAAALLADCIVRTKAVYLLGELSAPEAFWVYEVADFPGVVTMDAKGKSLHEDILQKTREARDRLFAVHR